MSSGDTRVRRNQARTLISWGMMKAPTHAAI
jgi:hypothetical protein